MDEELSGVYPAFVCDIKDAERRGRIKVICSEVFGDTQTESAWCEPCIPVAMDGSGDICVPPIGEGVWIAFIGGDIDRPVWLGGWHASRRTPFRETTFKGYLAAAKSTRMITYGGSRITMSDGNIVVDLEGSAGSLAISNGAVTFNCNVVVNGDVVINGRSFNAHTHTDSVGGATSAPR